jgi:sterol desaturase/sphingolipid hydroxylase (fatty acid hydroxylase superfamily)
MLGGVFVSLFVLERAFPLRRRTRSLAYRLIANMVVTVVAFAVSALMIQPTAAAVMNWPPTRRFGLLGWFTLPPAAELAAGFVLMDLTFYYWHRLNHRVGLLWRFHNVHHLDLDLDVTTSFRFHFGEIALSTVFRAMQVAVIGLTPVVFAVYNVFFLAATMFHHSNLRLPIRLERAINRLIVTPRMHGIHHSVVLEEDNSNYGVIFMGWDWLHRTLRLNAPQAAVVVGVPAYTGAETEGVLSLLAQPFRRQRDD